MEFNIEQAQARHGDEYIYRELQDSPEGTIRIICHRHGIFTMSIEDHVQRGYRCPDCVNDQLEAMKKRELFVKLRQQYVDAFRTFNTDTAWEILRCEDIQDLAVTILDNHEHATDAIEEVFDVFVTLILTHNL